VASMSVQGIEEISGDLYREWFERHAFELKYRSPFHNPAWLEASSSGIGFPLRFIGVFERGDLVAAVPGFLTRRGPFRLFGSPLRGLMTSYLGPVVLPGSDADVIDLVDRSSRFARKRWRVAYTRFSLRDAPVDEPPYLGPDWRHEMPRSYRVDLTMGVASLWAGLKSDCRRNVRKAERLGIATAELKDARVFYKMLDETMRRHGTASWHPDTFFHQLMDGLAPQDILWSWSANYQGKVVAAGLFLHDDNETHFLSGASDPEYGSLPTSYLLHWNAIEKSSCAGLRSFHSEASKVRSIDQFKESFRPTAERRHTLIWSPRFVRLAESGFMSASGRLRNLRNRSK
jgi:hypothetical protein